LRVVSVQSKVAQAHKQMEMLRQAADGGIQVARMVVMNYLAARQDLPPLDDIYLDNGIKVEISCQPGSINGLKYWQERSISLTISFITRSVPGKWYWLKSESGPGRAAPAG
jgi:hypothetical protein